jgi:hypothetical protein
MPQKINMTISNGNSHYLAQAMKSIPLPGANPSIAAPKAPTALNAPILARVHNVRPGCGSCGRH